MIYIFGLMKAKEVLNTLRISRATLFRYLADGKIKGTKKQMQKKYLKK
jgi:predicted site-specific integrase-resolvase